jgi:hypothetical protein
MVPLIAGKLVPSNKKIYMLPCRARRLWYPAFKQSPHTSLALENTHLCVTV